MALQIWNIKCNGNPWSWLRGSLLKKIGLNQYPKTAIELIQWRVDHCKLWLELLVKRAHIIALKCTEFFFLHHIVANQCNLWLALCTYIVPRYTTSKNIEAKSSQGAICWETLRFSSLPVCYLWGHMRRWCFLSRDYSNPHPLQFPHQSC